MTIQNAMTPADDWQAPAVMRAILSPCRAISAAAWRRLDGVACLAGPMLVLAMAAALSGCAAITNPVQNGVPVSRLPDEMLTRTQREGLETIPLSLLRQTLPTAYTLAAGDVLGVFVAGIFPLTLQDQQLPTPPVYFPSQINPLGAGLAPSLGYPVSIRSDGTIKLPLISPLTLDGLTIERANEVIEQAYVENGLVQAERSAVLVSLMQPRQERVLVFRQEVGGFAAGGRGDIATSNVKRGTAHIVDLRAYENDVLTALSNTGGLPGLDAYDGIYIFRGGQRDPELTRALAENGDVAAMNASGVGIVRIPTRWPPGLAVPFSAEDIILRTGDIILVEARARDFFYTGGLLPRGEFQIPRDYDLDVIEAVAQVRGTLLNGSFGGNNLNGLLIQPGVGNPNPSALTVIRRTPRGGQIPISVDLNLALRDPRERILIQPGDILILQETTGEAVARYVADVLNFDLAARFLTRGSTAGVATAGVPNGLGVSAGFLQFR